MRYLFLEDRKERTPMVVADYVMPTEIRPVYRTADWEIVRSYDEFTDWILKNGLPDVISFDHDLCDAHYAFKGDYNQKGMEKTGYHAVKWLVDFCLHEMLTLPTCYVHSMNPVGSENIRSYIKSAKKHLKI